jgi:acetylornithine/succinyldiaminopimelate/putrescine aminotransferase
MHGTTFGGGPLACAVALEFLNVIEEEKLLHNVQLRGAELREGLKKLVSQFDFIREIRAEGLMIGIELSVEGAPFVNEAMQRGLLINCTHDFTLRLLPAFIITKAQVREFLKLFEVVLKKTPKQAAAADSGNSAGLGRVAHAAARC